MQRGGENENEGECCKELHVITIAKKNAQGACPANFGVFYITSLTVLTPDELV